MGSDVESSLGGSLLLMPRGEEEISSGYSSADLRVGRNTKANQLRNYLLRYSRGGVASGRGRPRVLGYQS